MAREFTRSQRHRASLVLVEEKDNCTRCPGKTASNGACLDLCVGRFTQEKIQEWISAIPHHIHEVIRLEGGNEYKEGVQGFKRSWKGTRLKGKLSKLEFLSETQHQQGSGDNEDGEVDWEDDAEDEDGDEDD